MARRWTRIVCDPRLWIAVLMAGCFYEYWAFSNYLDGGLGPTEGSAPLWLRATVILHYTVNIFFDFSYLDVVNRQVWAGSFPTPILVLLAWFLLCSRSLWFRRHCLRLSAQAAVPGLGLSEHGLIFQVMSLLQLLVTACMALTLWQVQERVLHANGLSNQGVPLSHLSQSIMFVAKESWAGIAVLGYFGLCVTKGLVMVAHRRSRERALGNLCLGCGYQLKALTQCPECGEKIA